MRTLRISVRRLVEFLLRSGSIDSDHDWHGSIEAMQAGGEIHRKLQAAGGEAYQAEVPLASSIFFPDGLFNPHAARLDINEEVVAKQRGFFLRVEGRADGIIDDGTHPLIVDEIKGLARDISDLEQPAAIHEAQALCYAYLYLRGKHGPSILSSSHGEQVVIRLTYASMTTGELRRMERTHTAVDIEARFFSLLEKAQRWAVWRVDHDELRTRSLSALTFPLSPRRGQQEIMEAVDTTIRAGARLYVQAPTGSGKTLATLYPALEALGKGKASRVAFLTAKTMTRRAALQCLELLEHQGIATSVLVMTARDKICPLRSNARNADLRGRPLASLCNPVECPRARNHFDAVNDALYEVITTSTVFDFDHIEKVAEHYHVCPYELQRDAARWADVIICDYHYAFSPSARLLGLVDESFDGGTVFLVDEAHNLVERMRDMYSAELSVAELEELQRILVPKSRFARIAQTVHAALAAFPAWDRALTAGTRPGVDGKARKPSYQKVLIDDALSGSLTALADSMRAELEQLSEAPASNAIEVFLAMRDASFKVNAFLGTLNRSERGYVSFLSPDEHGGRRLKIYCVDPSHDLAERLEQAEVAVFFSGTLLPMDYHLRLLAAKEGDVSLYVQSGFNHRHQQVLIGSDISARFSKRGSELYVHIARYLMVLTAARPGNYLAFLPSYAMLKEVARALTPLVGGTTTVIQQRAGMREDERERFVATFRELRAPGTSLVGLCVLGGIFGESIDLPGEALVGVVVVGTGMPRATAEREVIRDYFDAQGSEGFSYAYRYPGLIKVLQAAGRLIRSEEDRGVVLLLDDRFLEDELQQVFPKEWQGIETCTIKSLPSLLA